ncbi:UNVERIFIED_CONTAM: hypothetical protein GTU68_031340 [Idotea baltica]|nr:hypothetical protein [Idotea baltica]
MSGNDVVLSVSGLTKSFGGLHAVRGVDFHVDRGAIVGLIGPNGAGKTTTFNMIAGELPPTSGRIELLGEDVTDTPAQKVIERGISYVPQTNNVFVNLSVQENLEMGAWTRPNGVEQRIAEMYDLFPDLAEKRAQAAGSLSGGQRQMVAMAKALMVDAKILLLDEPTAGLSPKYRGEIFATIQKIKGTGVPILIVEQNAKQALGVSDRGYVLVDGANRHTGTGAGLAADPEIARMFLGGGH